MWTRHEPVKIVRQDGTELYGEVTNFTRDGWHVIVCTHGQETLKLAFQALYHVQHPGEGERRE